MAVTYVSQVTPWTGSSPKASGSFTPTAGNCLCGNIIDGNGNSISLTASGTGTYKTIAPSGGFNDTHSDSHDAWANVSCSSGAQTITVAGNASDSVYGFFWQYSGVGSIDTKKGIQRTAPGSGTGAITGQAVTVASGDMLVAVCMNVAGGTNTITTSNGTNQRNGNLAGPVYWCAADFAGTGASITPAFTAADGTLDFFIIQWVMHAASGNTAVNPGVGNLTITGHAPGISQPHAVNPGVGNLTITGYAPKTGQNTNVRPGVGNLTLTGYAPSIAQPHGVNPGVGDLVITGHAPGISQPHAVNPGVGNLTITGYAPAVTQHIDTPVNPGVGNITITGYAPTVSRSLNQYILPGAGTLSLTGYSPSVTQAGSISLTPGVGNITIIGYAPVINQISTPSGGGGAAKKKKNKIIVINGIRYSVPYDQVDEFLARYTPENKTVYIPEEQHTIVKEVENNKETVLNYDDIAAFVDEVLSRYAEEEPKEEEIIKEIMKVVKKQKAMTDEREMEDLLIMMMTMF